jgi:hypothetical protein
LRLPIPPQRLKKKMNEFEMNIIESTPFVKKNVDLKKQIRLFEGSIKQDDKRQKWRVGRRTAPKKLSARYSNTIAVTGQLSTACWQSQVSQALGFATHALSSLSSNTLGQSSEHNPQPIQRSISTFGVAIDITILS